MESPIPSITFSLIPSPAASPTAVPSPTPSISPALSPLPTLTTVPLPTSSFFPASSGASLNPCPVNTQFIKLCNLQIGQIGQYISTLIAIVLVIAIILSLFSILFGAIRWIISGGDKQRAAAARGAVVHAIVGLIIVFLAYFIISVVLSFFGLSFTELTLPPFPR